MGVLHVFLHCTNGTKSQNASHISFQVRTSHLKLGLDVLHDFDTKAWELKEERKVRKRIKLRCYFQEIPQRAIEYIQNTNTLI